jgi:periplasmic protein TonB
MTARVDILEEPEHLRGPFLGSLLFHGSLIGAFVAVTTLHILGGHVEHWGDPHGGGMGAVAVTPVSIALPNRGSVPNPVANDTQSQVPAPPPTKQKAQPKPRAKAPDADAIPIKSRTATRRDTNAASQPNKWAEKQTYQSNQVYSSAGQAVSSPMYQLHGGGGVGIGNDSPLGTQFGPYANALLYVIGQHWHPTTMDSRLEKNPATVQFTLLRDGSLLPGSVKLILSSGSRELDYSAQRALLDVDKFPPLPPQFPRDRVDLQLHFDLRH